MVAISAAPSADLANSGRGLDQLKALLAKTVPSPHRNPDGPLVFCVDHCFQIKGQGTVLTGE